MRAWWPVAAGLVAAAVASAAGAGLLVIPATVAVLAAIRWRTAATVAGCLIVAAVAVEPVKPVALAVTAATLTGYLLIVDAAHARPGVAPVPALVVAVAIATVTVAAQLPHRPWLAPFGMAAAATAMLLAVAALRRKDQTRGGAK